MICFIGGIFWCSFFEISAGVKFLFLMSSLIFGLVFHRSKPIWIGVLCCLSFLFGVWHTENNLQNLEDAQRKNLNGRRIYQGAMISSDPQQKDNYQQFKVSLSGVDGMVLVRANSDAEFAYGDKVELDCSLSLVQNREGTENERFDYVQYLAKERIYYLCQKPKIKTVTKGQGNRIYGTLLAIRNSFANVIRRELPAPEAGLAHGILFGGSGLLDDEVETAFSRTGLTHIVAVSGYNVTIIAEYLILLGIWLGFWRKQALVFAIVGIASFVLLVGFPASAVRAGVMGGVVLWAMKNGRLGNSNNAIIFAGAIMLLLNPLLLRWDIGFQLSFLATIGIVLVAGLWDQKWIKKHDRLGLVETIILTISAQILVMPVIIYNFSTFSVISVFANMLVLPIIPLAMLLVFLTSVVGSTLPLFGTIFAWLSFLLLHYIIKIVELLAKISWASIEVELQGVVWIVVYYMAIFSLTYFLNKRKKYLKSERICAINEN